MIGCDKDVILQRDVGVCGGAQDEELATGCTRSNRSLQKEVALCKHFNTRFVLSLVFFVENILDSYVYIRGYQGLQPYRPFAFRANST